MMLTAVLMGLTVLLSAPAAVETDGVVLVETATGHGTGMVISPTEVLTAAHVAAGVTSVRVTQADGAIVNGGITHLDDAADLALVQLEEALVGAPPVSLSAELPSPGQDVLAVGYAMDRAVVTVSRGIVSAIREQGAVRLVQTDAAINEGMSGGPLLSSDGDVVGMVISKLEHTEGMGMAVSASDIETFLAAEPMAPDVPTAQAVPMADGWMVWLALAIPAGLILVLARNRPRGVSVRLGDVRIRKNEEI